MSSSSMRYTSRCSSVMRRDQAPASRCRSGSGLPMPLVGSRITSLSSRFNRFSVALSVRCQYL